MKNLYRWFYTGLVILLPLFSQADVSLPRLVSDNMVLQRNSKLNIWGWASPGEKIAVEFNRYKLHTTTDANGKWQLVLPEMKAGGPFAMTIKGNNTLVVNNILIGEVWLCGGQSNMEFKLNKVRDRYAQDIANSGKYPIREFAVKEKYGFDKVVDVEGSWKMADPLNVLQFTAVGYFFAKHLYDQYKVPVGLIYSSWPGTPAESWISEEVLKKDFPHYAEVIKQYKDTAYVNEVLKKDRTVADEWYAATKLNDKGTASRQASWANPAADTAGWKNIRFPGYWETQGLSNIDGVVWIKKTINIPSSMAGKDLQLHLGLIDDIDTTYFNGQRVGYTDNKYNPRRYVIPAKLVKAGLNTLTIRIIDNEGNGGIVPGKTYDITDGETAIDLSGDWLYKIGYAGKPLPVQSFTRIYYKPGILYHTMIEPLTPYTIKGAIWYQGEANTGPSKAIEYRKLLPTMITEWRNAWGQGNFPFLIVQLANFMKPPVLPQESGWAMLRESQLMVAATVPNSGLAVAIDLGEENDIHPPNKKDVGIRLALGAQKVAYHDDKVAFSGPVYKTMEVKGDKVLLAFDHTGKGLTAKAGSLKQFAIAGADKRFVWASAKIEGDKVVVWSKEVPAPVAVRYAWADNPAGCSLYNADGLPASPFRTDDWNK